MKHIRIFTLAVTIMSCIAANAAADEFEFSTPDINGTLDRKVEEKMDSLINKLHVDQGYSRIVEQLEDELNNLPTVMKKRYEYDFTQART